MRVLLRSIPVLLTLGVVSSASAQYACTMDAKLCPDGVTYVGRDGNNNCEWQKCPGGVMPEPPTGCTRDVKVCPDGSSVGREKPYCTFAECPPQVESCSPYICANGKTHPRCSEDGTVINYFAAPCHMDGGEEGAPFADVSSDHPFGDAIFYVKAQGIVQGYEDGTFKPDTTINRAEFVKILTHALEDDVIIQACVEDTEDSHRFFADVPPGAWYEASVCHAKGSQWIGGYPDGTFKPANSINFVEAAKILVKAFGLEASTTIPACEGDCPWYRPYVLMLEAHGAIPPGPRRFSSLLSRGEMAEMIYRLKAGTDKSSGTYADMELWSACQQDGSCE